MSIGPILSSWCRIVLAVLALVSVSAHAQLEVYYRSSVAPNGQILSECYIARVDANTVANYDGIKLTCIQERNGSQTEPTSFSVVPSNAGSGVPAISIYGSASASWSPLDIFNVVMVGELIGFLNGTDYEDPMGYSGAVKCGPYYPSLPGYPPVQNYVCPTGQSATTVGPVVFSFSSVPIPIDMPVIPILNPVSATVASGEQVKISATRLSSSGQMTSAPAVITNWSLATGSDGGGSLSAINTSAENYVGSPTSTLLGTHDTVLAKGSLCIICTTPATATALMNFSPTAPSPTISLGSGAVGGCQTAAKPIQQVYAGQLIKVTGCLPSSASPVTVGYWTPSEPDPATAVGYFNVVTAPITGHTDQTTAVRQMTPVASTYCSAQAFCDYGKLYFTLPGTYVFEFSYAPPAGYSSPKPASVEFQVLGPNATISGTLPITATTSGGVAIVPAGDGSFNSGATYNANPILTSAVGPYINNFDGPMAFEFKAAWQLPSGNPGSWLWAQVITNDDRSRLAQPAIPNIVMTPGLDNSYPYCVPNVCDNEESDSPAVTLAGMGYSGIHTVYEQTRSFAAQMYLLWTPAVDPLCSDPALKCAIEIPIGSVSWSFNASAYNTLDTMLGSPAINGWLLEGCSQDTIISVNTSTGTASYPNWTGVLYNK